MKFEKEDVADLFLEEENPKKQKKIEKKQKKQEEKENIAFLKQQAKEKRQNLENKTIPTVPNFLYDTVFGFIIICSFLTSIGYFGYTIYTKSPNKLLIQNGLLMMITFFYMLSFSLKKEGAKKFFGILSALSLMGWVLIQFYLH